MNHNLICTKKLARNRYTLNNYVTMYLVYVRIRFKQPSLNVMGVPGVGTAVSTETASAAAGLYGTAAPVARATVFPARHSFCLAPSSFATSAARQFNHRNVAAIVFSLFRNASSSVL